MHRAGFSGDKYVPTDVIRKCSIDQVCSSFYDTQMIAVVNKLNWHKTAESDAATR